MFCVSHTYCIVDAFILLPPVSDTVAVVLAVCTLLAPFVPNVTVGATESIYVISIGEFV
ncbi:hypothetical protein D3C76_941310 [compost metagenome]